jgi:hypothetical protein
MPNEVIELYRNRVVSAVDVAVYAALCSLRRDYDGVRLSQRKIAIICNINPKTVAASVQRLYSCRLNIFSHNATLPIGFIFIIIHESTFFFFFYIKLYSFPFSQ